MILSKKKKQQKKLEFCTHEFLFHEVTAFNEKTDYQKAEVAKGYITSKTRRKPDWTHNEKRFQRET